jgi:putative ABC transport system permease protein
LRSLLTLSGIVFGTASLVSMTSLSAAMKTMAYAELASMGFPRSFRLMDRDPRSDARRAAELTHPGLRLADLAALRALPGVDAVHGRTFVGDLLVSTPLERRMLPVDGVDAGYLTLRHYRIVAGRELAPLDVGQAARVAVIGAEVVNDFFAAADPVGRTIAIDGVRFRIVGVVAPLELNLVPADFSFTARRIYIPHTYVTRYLSGQGRVGQALVTVSAGADVPRVLRAGRALLSPRHNGAEDFEVANEAAEVLSDFAIADSVLGGWNIVLFAIAGITLVVGGIGLFSVLLISVRERVREIGIRKALGAHDGEILRLFLAESLLLSATGATGGILGGAGLVAVTRLIAHGFGKSFAIPLHVPGILTAIIFSLIVGLVFGWYPARRAARLDPIEAIGGE